MSDNFEVKKYLKDNNFVPSKKMGQNFLFNTKSQTRLVELSEINEDDFVLEIGPGLGAITQHIIKITRNYLAIELDKRLCEFLRNKFQKINIINNDVLKTDISSELNNLNFKKVKVVANLPYSISSLIIIKLARISNIDEINILVQKEMAERLLAKPNSKDYNAFTVLTSMYFDISHLGSVSRNDFIPVPNVDSWFIRLTRKNSDLLQFDEMDKFLKLCFISKRKKILNNLSNKYPKDVVFNVLKALKIDENARAESLSIETFIELYKELKNVKD